MKSQTSIFLATALLAAAFTALPASAAEVREISGRQYVQQGSGWVQRDDAGREYRVQSGVITIKLREGVTRGAEEALHAGLDGEVLRRARTGFIDVTIDAGRDVFEAIDAYLASGLVEIAEPNTWGEYSIVPNDTMYPSQWHFPVMSAEEAWDITPGSSDVVVAILDSGTEFSHEDMGLGGDAYQNIWLNDGEDAWSDPDDPATGNGIDDDGNGYVDDWKGYDFSNNNNDSSGTFFHGTAVAGCTSAKTHNGTGVAGMAGGWNDPGTRLMVCGVGDDFPDGAALDDGILYAADNGAHVVQMSLSVGQSSAIDAALQMAHDDDNVTIICASGNGFASTVAYPASDSHVIAVGATNQSDQKVGFSNHGPDLEVSAPGVDILMPDLNDGYGTSGGTSFSAPLTSGVVALMLAAHPGLTNVQIRQILHDTADKVGGYDYDWNGSMPGHSFELGYGRVDAESAVLAAANTDIFADGFESGDTTAWSSSTP